jgi:hypothetical protein
VQALSGPAFTWYSKLAPGSIRTWEQMQDAFLEHFYSTQRMVGVTKLTQMLQRSNEKAADFINRWRNLSLDCPQPITEPEAVHMCMNSFSPNMAIYLQDVRPISLKSWPLKPQILKTICNISNVSQGHSTNLYRQLVNEISCPPNQSPLK